jgi:hypothetical protein
MYACVELNLAYKTQGEIIPYMSLREGKNKMKTLRR